MPAAAPAACDAVAARVDGLDLWLRECAPEDHALVDVALELRLRLASARREGAVAARADQQVAGVVHRQLLAAGAAGDRLEQRPADQVALARA